MSGRVLIVDDDEGRRTAWHGAIRSKGFETVSVCDAFGAMAALRGSPMNVMVASGSSGVQTLKGVCQLARRRSPEIVICIVGAPADQETELQGVVPGGCKFLSELAPESLAEVVAGNPPLPADAVPAPPPPKEPTPFQNAAAKPAGKLDVDVKGDGAVWLMHLSAKNATGYLEVEGVEVERIYFQSGAPVWVVPVGGDRRVYEMLSEQRLVLPSDHIEPVPEGRLLSSLYSAGVIAPALVEKFMRAEIKAAVIALLELETGRLSYTADPSAAQAPALVQLDPFGMIFEHQRSIHTPDALLRKGRTMRPIRVNPLPDLVFAREKVKAFFRGQDASELLDGRTIEELNTAVGHDEVMGTTVVLAMEAAGLCRLQGSPTT